MEICPVYASKYNQTSKKQISLLMISNEIIWHHLAAKKLSALLRRVISELLCQLKKIIFLNLINISNQIKHHV